MAAVHSRLEDAATTRQPAPPGLPDSAAGGTRSRLALALVGFFSLDNLSLASPAMRGRRRLVNTAFGG
ncbi:MAG: hypothetical protein WC076_12695, partial [Terrimicrobiaceae bacterium]